MKKLFLLILALIFISSLAEASPFLISDAYPPGAIQPTYFSVIIDGGSPIQSIPVSITGGLILKYDLGTISIGSHTITISACNLWGCSSTVPFVFTRSVPIAPSGVQLSP